QQAQPAHKCNDRLPVFATFCVAGAAWSVGILDLAVAYPLHEVVDLLGRVFGSERSGVEPGSAPACLLRHVSVSPAPRPPPPSWASQSMGRDSRGSRIFPISNFHSLHMQDSPPPVPAAISHPRGTYRTPSASQSRSPPATASCGSWACHPTCTL